MSTHLFPGDKISYLSPKGLKLRAIVQESMEFRERGAELLVPVARIFNRKNGTCVADKPSTLKVRWLPRSRLRKLPK